MKKPKLGRSEADETTINILRPEATSWLLVSQCFIGAILAQLIYRSTSSSGSALTAVMVVTPTLIFFIYRCLYRTSSRISISDENFTFEFPLSELTIPFHAIHSFRMVQLCTFYIIKIKILAYDWKNEKTVTIVCDPRLSLVSFDEIVRTLSNLKREKLHTLID